MKDKTGLFSVVRRAAWFVLAALAAGFLVRQVSFIDRQMIYFPQRELTSTPADVGLPFEDVYLTASDGTKLHGWYVPGEEGTTLLWFHGNAGNIGHRVDNILTLHRALDANIMILDYRGYGRSEGRPSERGLYLDAEAAIEYLIEQRGVDPTAELVLFGRSLGVGVAVEMAARYPTRAVILESGFPSVREMAHRAYPILPTGLILTLVEARYDSISKIGDVSAPVMVLHGDRDEIVPFELGQELFEAATEPKTFYRIRGAGHNDTHQVGEEPYYQALRDFVDETGPSH